MNGEGPSSERGSERGGSRRMAKVKMAGSLSLSLSDV